MPDLPPDAHEDCFHPPSIPTEVYCLHCQQTYDSYLIEWRESICRDGKKRGFWCCPTPGCDGAGFGFDIHPVDPGYIDPDGRDLGQWIDDECDEECTGDEDSCCCECCLIARGEYEPADDEAEFAGFAESDCHAGRQDIPLDDLLPVNEEVGDAEVSYDTMIEIEEKLGFRKPRDKPSEVKSPPKHRRDHPPISDDDLPF